jgi:hypothetical protein
MIVISSQPIVCTRKHTVSNVPSHTAMKFGAVRIPLPAQPTAPNHMLL